jgi:hypothetical protein
MKTIQINGTSVECSHEVKTDESHQTSIHVTVKAGDVETTHVMTIGAVDEPLPLSYDASVLQKDLDAFRQKSATMAESKMRAKSLASQLQ